MVGKGKPTQLPISFSHSFIYTIVLRSTVILGMHRDKQRTSRSLYPGWGSVTKVKGRWAMQDLGISQHHVS